ncbi:MAG TPA: ketol-acid reductoisomerase [Candidatus Dormibacteraeota bacterium]|nr:ketol-acid reductoisomerase [Candidatus Dormibacteraeota bacterium]
MSATTRTKRKPNLFESKVFAVERVELDGVEESFLRGGRHLFGLLPKALAGIKQIGLIGWGSQGPAQAQNLRESLAGTGIKVVVGLRAGSESFADARAAGFSEKDGTLGEMFEVIRGSDLTILLISDAAQAQLHRRVFDALKPGSTLGLSHGFLLGYLETAGEKFPANVNVIAVCPKGMGPSVRRLYEQGREINGAGINTSFAVEQDLDGRATDIALGWSVALGAPYTFKTTLKSEVVSDLFGERSILLGAVHGIVEALYRRYLDDGATPEDAFDRACESLTGPIRETISKQGLIAVDEQLTPDGRRDFRRAYDVTYAAFKGLMAEIYDEVVSGNEIRSVVAAAGRFDRFPMTKVEGSPMWQTGSTVRKRRGHRPPPIDGFTAGTYCGAMMAQVDTLIEKGHPYSEIANESIIEAVDSLLPYMHARGVAYMVDNCSTTARLGTRKWGPRFQAMLEQVAFPGVASQDETADEPPEGFLTHPVHEVLHQLGEMRPAVDISVS